MNATQVKLSGGAPTMLYLNTKYLYQVLSLQQVPFTSATGLSKPFGRKCVCLAFLDEVGSRDSTKPSLEKEIEESLKLTWAGVILGLFSIRIMKNFLPIKVLP